ncbi:hypothetical protein [Allobranchiibius huperziae]|uniref:Uncharacterized protein n=1 Tax=Allobranchiibius huperziae TaxID=1874116 RepID=A0A853D886_9MICO|nr:hypothetical protein [Allobranchiibius huperziae]NYJ73636.1 hypothetical protein [Allobranchiibius huperziae]
MSEASGMMRSVGTKQLVVHASTSGDELDAVERRDDTRPWDYADQARGTSPKLLGTIGLLRLAEDLALHGYRLAEIDVRDSTYDPLADEAEYILQNQLKEALTSGDSVRRARDLLLAHDSVLVSITVRGQRSGHELIVNRDGELRFRMGLEFDEFRNDLSRALGYSE